MILSCYRYCLVWPIKYHWIIVKLNVGNQEQVWSAVITTALYHYNIMWLPYSVSVSQACFFLQHEPWQSAYFEKSFPKQGAGIAACSTHSALCWSNPGGRLIVTPLDCVNSAPGYYASNYCLTCNTGMRHPSAGRKINFFLVVTWLLNILKW